MQSLAVEPHQRRRRVVAKTVCYRLFMLLVTISVAFLFTGELGSALNIGVVTNLVKTGTYYGYERVWDHVTWGVVD